MLGLVLVAFAVSTTAVIPLPAAPDWTSHDDDYATGIAFADFTGDGLVDLATSNGNDMAHDSNAVYVNVGGALETAASWRSADRGMFGHCYAGDVDRDGRPDLAVVSLGPESTHTKLVARLYRNSGAGLDPLPAWRAADRHSSFDCCLGDFDLDGRLDLAVSAGDAYRNERDPARVYRNTGPAFDTLPAWSAQFDTASDAVRFCDIDNDGDLDLFVGHRRQVSMFRNNAGALETSPCWTARAGVGWVLRLAFGDYDQDGWPDLAVASNGQLLDSNSIRVYRNNAGTLDAAPSFVMLRANRYSSCVAWGDVNGDGYPELAAGGWWEPVVVFENNAGTLGTVPAWSWRPANIQELVCEALAFADVGNRRLEARFDEFAGDGSRRLWSLGRGPAQFIDSVTVDGAAVPPGSWCADPLAAWFSLETVPPAGAAVRCHYRYAARPDLAVSNWHRTAGNHLFRNTDASPVAEAGRAPVPARLRVRPSPARGPVTFTAGPGTTPLPPLDIYASDGRLARRLLPGPAGWHWDLLDGYGRRVVPGSYFGRAGDARVRLVVAR
ncbi:MAG: VCBS repeat-containing protein [bacterium]